jgi:UDP-GlcNAc3NAcA epimerase
MKKIVTIIGARPQIIKASAISRAISTRFSTQLTEVIVHTGQHYDANMSDVFFKELQIPKPNYNLNVGSGAHGLQTAKMIEGIESILVKEKPNVLLVYGDTNSTLAGAIAASKIQIPVVHIEAGLRSFNKSMPEEINRIMSDHVSTLLFSPTKAGLDNLLQEGFKVNNNTPYTFNNPKIYHCGDIMYDNSMHFSEVSDNESSIIAKTGITKNNFVLSTIHRNNNTDDKKRLTAIFKALNEISLKYKLDIVLPLHPRTKKLLETNVDSILLKEIKNNSHFKIIEPVSFLDMIALEKHAKLIVTDSGGVQKEAFFFEKPCVILRPETEWTELVDHGTAIIADADTNKIINAFDSFLTISNLTFPPLFGDGKAAEFICEEIINL